jgi:sugar phosphate permease
MSRPGKIFYGWYIVVICIISMILIYGIRHSFAVFFSPILNEFGWSRGDIAMMLSLNILVYGFLAPVAGALADRWRSRVLIPGGILILGLATAGCAFANRLWHFYFFFGFLMSIGTALSGWPIFAPALVNWFAKRRGLVLGLGQMGGGLSFVYSIFVELTIRHLGWRHAFLALAAILVASLLPVLLLFFHYRPQERKMQAYGTEDFPPGKEIGPSGKKRVNLGPPLEGGLKEILKTPQLWFLVTSYALYWGIAGYLVMAHQVRFLQDKGFSSAFSASIFALLGIMIFLGQLSAFLSDWLGREKTHTLAACLSIGGLFALLFVRGTSQTCLLYAFAVLFGFGGGLATPVTYAASADIFHGKHFGTVGGLLLGGMGVGSVLGPWLGGYLFDISGSYTIAFIFCIISLVFSCLFLWISAPRKAVSQI